MIWAALFIYLAYLFGGSPVLTGNWLINDSKSQFKEVIQDKERSKKAMNILDEMIRDAKDFNREAEKDQKGLEKLVKDYHSNREDFNHIFAEIQKKRETLTLKVLDRFPDLKKNIAREEWAKAFKK